jgi:hypothetical protein
VGSLSVGEGDIGSGVSGQHGRHGLL